MLNGRCALGKMESAFLVVGKGYFSGNVSERRCGAESQMAN